MRVAIISYPMLFQRTGGLQVQVRETLAALRDLGVAARLFDVNADRLADYDIIHVFGTGSGNHAIVAAVKAAGRPVVLSPILTLPWSKRDAFMARLGDRVVGRLTGWNVRTTYHHMCSAIRGADCLLAMGEAERTALIDCFGADASRIDIVPNGVTEGFFTASAEPFAAAHDLTRPFVLCVASISEYKNQLGLISALKDTDLDVVLIGPCEDANRPYLEACRTAGGARVRYIGALAHDDPLLASAFAGAAVTALVSAGEASPITVIESLAAGTPVVITSRNGLQLDRDASVWREVSPSSQTEIREHILSLVGSKPSREDCRRAVAHMRWSATADRILGHYREILSLAAS